MSSQLFAFFTFQPYHQPIYILKLVISEKRKAPSDGRSTDENSAGKRHKTQKKPWNPSEMNSVNKHFSHFIAMSKVPGKNDIENVLKKDKILSKRTWRNVKDQVYNLIKKQRKC